ncbi:MAG: hypothetical protein L3K01_06875 [Thermoplasmata archaeon]|nr:hypothetical protein [Thermoplasmata archaeon]
MSEQIVRGVEDRIPDPEILNDPSAWSRLDPTVPDYVKMGPDGAKSGSVVFPTVADPVMMIHPNAPVESGRFPFIVRERPESPVSVEVVGEVPQLRRRRDDDVNRPVSAGLKNPKCGPVLNPPGLTGGPIPKTNRAVESPA